MESVGPGVAWLAHIADEHAPPAAAQHQGPTEPCRSASYNQTIVRHLSYARPAIGASARHDVSGIHDLLEAPEIIRHLLRRLFPEQLRYRHTHHSGRWLVAQHDAHVGTRAVGRRREVHRARVVHFGSGK